MDAGLRTVLRLAVPALGALAAEPLYVLVDTAIVGHLGSTPLAGLAVASTLFSSVVALANFLEYGTTGAVARLLGAGRRDEALAAAAQATWLAVISGLCITLLSEAAAEPLLHLIAGGGNAAVEAAAVSWLRIAALGAPFVCITLAGQGWLRGFQDTVTPLLVVVAGNLCSALLSLLLVYGAHLGIRGSAIANAVAQSGSAVVFTVALVRRGAPPEPRWPLMREQLRAARDLGVRTLAFLASFGTATAVASRMGGTTVAAHQIAIQLWEFLALVLDSLAIAAQALVGTAVGAGEIAAARELSWRLLRWGGVLGTAFAVVLLAGWNAIPALFTSDPAVIARCHAAWGIFAAMLPIAGALFALDGVFIGAGDVAFMRNVTVVAGLGVYLPLTLLAYAAGFGLAGVWAGLFAFVAVRFAGGVWRAARRQWWRAGLEPLRDPAAAVVLPPG